MSKLVLFLSLFATLTVMSFDQLIIYYFLFFLKKRLLWSSHPSLYRGNQEITLYITPRPISKLKHGLC